MRLNSKKKPTVSNNMNHEFVLLCDFWLESIFIEIILLFVSAIPFSKLNDRIIYYAKKTKRDNVVGMWHPCKLLDMVEIIGNNNDHVVQFRDGTKKDVASYELAYGVVPMPSVLEKGTRVIAPRRSEDLPYKFGKLVLNLIYL